MSNDPDLVAVRDGMVTASCAYNGRVIESQVGGNIIVFQNCTFKSCTFTYNPKDNSGGGTVLFVRCSFVNCTFSRDILTMLAFHDCKGIIYMGRRNDYVVLASAFDDRGYMIHAGCRKFRLRKARAHWRYKSGRAEIRRAVEEIAWLAARRVAAGSSIWRAR